MTAAEGACRAAAATLDEVSVRLAGRVVLGPLTLSIGAGEHWAVLGPNGAGKSTLLSLLGAQRHPSEGNATVLGGRLGRVDLRELRREIGMVGHLVADRLPPQVSALEIVLTGRDGLLAPWWGEFDEADRAEARTLLARLRCAEIAEQPIQACSQGERQRILLARSLFGRHRLLLLDEPAVGVDLPGREALVQALDSLAAEADGPTTVLVVHTLEELPTSTSHVLLLRGGRTVAAGATEDVLDAAALSACYGSAFSLQQENGRYSARAAGSW